MRAHSRVRISNVSLEPIELYLREEDPPDDTVVVLRGGPIVAEKVLEHAQREARAYSLGGLPLYSVSVSLAVDGWSVDRLLAGPLASRSTYAVTTLGSLRAARFLALPTFASPHHDIVMESGGYDEASRLLRMFSESLPNPYKRRR